jgi:uncharacterized membrane protein YGL010W
MPLGNRSWDEWIAQYSASHQNSANRICHMFGIPLIAASLLLTPLLAIHLGWWKELAFVFILGWVLQFAGHAFEGKPPEFFKDPRFLFVGLRWWFSKCGAGFSARPSREKRGCGQG